MFLLTLRGFAQSATLPADTLRTKDGANKSITTEKGKNTMGNESTHMVAKQVRNGRPDLTRSAGARPPVIFRPSGAGIPRGIGKPGGAGGKGGR